MTTWFFESDNVSISRCFRYLICICNVYVSTISRCALAICLLYLGNITCRLNLDISQITSNNYFSGRICWLSVCSSMHMSGFINHLRVHPDAILMANAVELSLWVIISFFFFLSWVITKLLGGVLTLKGNSSYSVSLVIAFEMKHASTLPLTCYYFKIFCLNFEFLILKEIIINKKPVVDLKVKQDKCSYFIELLCLPSACSYCSLIYFL